MVWLLGSAGEIVRDATAYWWVVVRTLLDTAAPRITPIG
jgi:hypothetical protein